MLTILYVSKAIVLNLFCKEVDIRTGVVIVYKTKRTFLHFLYFFGIFIGTQTPSQRTKVEVTENESVEYS